MIKPKTKSGLGRIFELGLGEYLRIGHRGAGCPILRGPKYFSTYSKGNIFFFLQGPGPPKPLRGSDLATMLTLCLRCEKENLLNIAARERASSTMWPKAAILG